MTWSRGTGSSSGTSTPASRVRSHSAFGRRRSAGARRQRVARVEHHRAALLHVGGDARDRARRRLRPPGDDRPVDQRIEAQFVARGIERDRLGDFRRGALVEHAPEIFEPEARGLVDRRVAGDDIGEMGRARRLGVAIGVSAPLRPPTLAAPISAAPASAPPSSIAVAAGPTNRGARPSHRLASPSTRKPTNAASSSQGLRSSGAATSSPPEATLRPA